MDLNQVMSKDSHIVYNYFKMVADDGEVMGYGAVEKGSPNEIYLVNQALELNLKLEKTTKEEFDGFDGDVVKNF